MTVLDRRPSRALRSCVSAILAASLGAAVGLAQHGHGSEGVGTAHMETSCAPATQASFDRALAVLHNFWYARALTQFQEIQKADPECAMAYWGAAMTYNHPLWDQPSQEDETAAWALVQKGLKARSQSDREHMYLLAVAALYKDAGAGTKQSRDEGYRDQMAATHAKYPDDETKLFYGLSILGTIREGTKGFEMQGKAIELFESVYAHDKQHPGVLHYLIHGYDDPVHAEAGLAAARVYAKTAAAVPHAYHMPSHIFTRLGYWSEAATTNENAWQISNDDVKEAGEPGELRDFHSLNYLSYDYLQLGRYKDAKKTVDLFAAQYAALTNRRTAPDSQDLQARHVRGRTIFALPDRVLYGYFDSLARFIVESESWSDVPTLPLIAPSSDFVVMKTAPRGHGRLEEERRRHGQGQSGADDGARDRSGSAPVRAADSDHAGAGSRGAGRADVGRRRGRDEGDGSSGSDRGWHRQLVATAVSDHSCARALRNDAHEHGQDSGSSQALRGDPPSHARQAQGHFWHRAGCRGNGRYGHGQDAVHPPH